MMWVVIVGWHHLKKKISWFCFTLICMVVPFWGVAQESDPFLLRVVSYNVENLFDPEDDANTLDDEFTMSHYRRWSYTKYYHKIDQIAKVLVAVFPHAYPDIICLSEVENKKVLKDLIYHPLLKGARYEIVHRDGPDPRGIDVAILYRKTDIWLDSLAFVTIVSERRAYREVVHPIFTWHHFTFHLWATHLPSNYSGVRKSQKERKECVTFLSSLMLQYQDSLCHIWLGDFNMEPESRNVTYVKNSLSSKGVLESLVKRDKTHPGSLRYHERWYLYDLIFLWKRLPDRISVEDSGIFNPPFVLTSETKYGGVKPFRTYIGYRYQKGGFSDHLPVYVTFRYTP
ncbi:hypothetical protein K5X82_09415 [Halosquirtibacter xylanolyticus]|uniref:endonuclease/exonuclease/phosphatase family protein n=1 Tax=Halosquirtibacter xylanolyticus TaxID=3374599 RepID=UPI00374891A4|nr:hypothetical protein K5X82_09415 [Prolixibacteraceae bacterium]